MTVQIGPFLFFLILLYQRRSLAVREGKETATLKTPQRGRLYAVG